jgi:hypothetical protein
MARHRSTLVSGFCSIGREAMIKTETMTKRLAIANDQSDL